VAVIGREQEIERLRGLRSGDALIVAGMPGTGKTILLEQAARDRAVLRACGARSEMSLPFAALHQLLTPVLDRTGDLPIAQRSALLTAFGPATGSRPDAMQLGLAVLSLMAVRDLVVVDDVQWLDRASLQTIAFAARRAPVPVLVGARDDAPLPLLDGIPRLDLGPLSAQEANRLLDALPQPPRGVRRARILAEAAGNPLALIEFASVGSSSGSLPAAERLKQSVVEQLAGLPERARAGLLLLAAADGGEDVRVDGLDAAAHVGVVRWTGTRFSFRHPLARSAVYHSVPIADRQRAHAVLAGQLEGEPDRKAWHHAAAAGAPDESIADDLERTASLARARGGHAAAACALQRAAELSPRRADQARRYALAADAALLTGQARWVEELAGLVTTRTELPSLRERAQLRAVQASIVSARTDTAFTRLMRVDAPEDQVLASAAVVAYQSGDPAQREHVRARLGSVTDPIIRTWATALTDPIGATGRALPELEAGAGLGSEIAMGTTAWLRDDTSLALRLFEAAAQRLGGPLPEGLGCAFGWAQFDTGQWEEVLHAAAESAGSAAWELAHVRAGALVMEATVRAVRGETATARRLAEQALRILGSGTRHVAAVRARWALGTAAVADGDHGEAYAQFRRTFSAEGLPLHFHQSIVGLPELAVTAVRVGAQEHAARAVAAARELVAEAASPRLRALLARAEAALAPDPESYFRAAVEPRTAAWPFERALALLEFAEWLRRRRRIAAAREPLTEAAEEFRRLGARPWVRRAEAELRAAGAAPAQTSSPSGLAQLSPQQQEIVRLAARGLTNRQIGARLYLSPRTVGSHLYRTFPKLGVSSRGQLREMLGSETGADGAPQLSDEADPPFRGAVGAGGRTA
jgi:DNA-binding CsgD family transcriptional regulator